MYHWHAAWDNAPKKEVVAIDPIGMQIENFLTTVFCGLIIGFLFDGYRVLRGIFHPTSFITGVGDLVFWVLSTLVVFISLLLTNWGEVRLYVFIGLAIGLSLYIKLLSRFVTCGLIKTWRICIILYRWAGKFIYTLVWRPVVWIISKLAGPFLWIYRKPGRRLLNAGRTMGKRCKERIVKGWLKPKDPPE